jgi:hypothetical protein
MHVIGTDKSLGIDGENRCKWHPITEDGESVYFITDKVDLVLVTKE